MSDLFKTVLLVGATSGTGEELAQQYHARGKKVIISGRRVEKLEQLKAELPEVEGIKIDIQDLDSITNVIDQAFDDFPSIDAVLLVAGQQSYYNFNTAQPSPVPGKGTPHTSNINSEILTNLTGPIILTREIIKHALSAPRPFTVAFVTSGLAYVPIPIFPVYCAAKAALHYFIVSVRAQLSGSNIHVVEIVPPYVKTGLDAQHQDVLQAMLGGIVPPGYEVGEYVHSGWRGEAAKGRRGTVPFADGYCVG